jgi:hypothetical protein
MQALKVESVIPLISFAWENDIIKCQVKQEALSARNQAYDISVTPEQQKLNVRRPYKLSAEAGSTSETYCMPIMAAFPSTAK